MPVTNDEFRHVLGRFASGVTVVTTNNDGQLSGLTVSAFSSVSLEPPLVLICVDKQSSANQAIQAAKAYAVNILREGQDSLSNHFARRTPDKFADVDYHLGNLNLPLLEGTLGFLECAVTQTVDAGDHYIYLGQVENASADANAKPLLYFSGGYRQLPS